MNYTLSEIAVPITKEFLLSHNSEETYMSTYLGIPVKHGLQVSPLRPDKKPTASFYRNKRGDLMFHDFGTGFHGNFISVVMELNKCTFVEALQTIASDFGLLKTCIDKPKSVKKIIKSDVVFEESKDTIIQIQQQPFTEKDLQWWNSFGITEETLNLYNVFSCKNVFLNSSWFTNYSDINPIYGYYGGQKNDIELWRIYFPKKKTFRFLSNWSASMIQGLKQLPYQGDLVVITKSMKDVMCLHELGISAIAPCSETLFISDYALNKLKKRFKHIVVFYDNDRPGLRSMVKIRKQHPELSFFFIPQKFEAKDTSDFVKKYGIEYTKSLITKCLSKYGIDYS